MGQQRSKKVEYFKKARIVVFLGFILLFLLTNFSIFAEEINFSKDPSEALKKELKIKLAEFQEQVKKYENLIEEQRQQQASLKNEINILNNQIKKINLEIQSIDYEIEDIQIAIDERNEEIMKIEKKLGNNFIFMKILLNKLWQYDNTSEIEVILSNNSISGFFANISAVVDLQKRIKVSSEEIKELRNRLVIEKEEYNRRLEEQTQLKLLQERQRKEVNEMKSKLNKLLAQTKGKEKTYHELLKQTNKSAAEIQKQIFELEGSGLKMTFGEAYNYARFASSKTGVREALILAVLKYESKWGNNIGSGNWQKDMAPSQRPYFLMITQELGLNADGTPVSKKPTYGWGGAMGPAQMLPSVWLNYKDRIAAITGHNPPSPWNIQDAFAAVALKLADDGAVNHNYYAEWKAAMIYFAGNNWSKPSYKFYGNKVMELANQFQSQIDLMLSLSSR